MLLYSICNICIYILYATVVLVVALWPVEHASHGRDLRRFPNHLFMLTSVTPSGWVGDAKRVSNVSYFPWPLGYSMQLYDVTMTT